MASRIIQGDIFDVIKEIPSRAVDCVVTSPPYWQVRSYLGKGHLLKKYELGSEPTPADFVKRLVEVFGLVREAMADHGTLWLNCGDTYATTPAGVCADPMARTTISGGRATSTHANETARDMDKAKGSGLRDGNLCLIPQRLMIALQEAGWVVRSVVVWHKPAPMPASVSGWTYRRCRVKVQEGGRGGNGKARMEASGNRVEGVSGGIVNAPLAQWQDCPGCAKCEPNAVTCDRCGGLGALLIGDLQGGALAGVTAPVCPDCGGRGKVGYVLRKGSWRPTSSWEPVVMLAKGSGYFCDGEAVRVIGAGTNPCKPTAKAACVTPGNEENGTRARLAAYVDDPAGANPRDVLRTPLEDMTREELIDLARALTDDGQARDLQSWASEPLKDQHYAAFPSALPMWCLRAGTSSRGYCPSCGKPWCRVVETKHGGPTSRESRREVPTSVEGNHNSMGRVNGSDTRGLPSVETTTLDWRPSCRCIGAETFTPRPGLVCDPFCGSGRVGIAAQRLGLDFVGVELSEEYCEISKRILFEDAPLFS